MSSSNYRFTLDMQSNQSQVALPVRLNDTNRKLYIILTNGGTPFIMETGSYAVLSAKKSNGNELLNNCEIEDNSVICYTFTEQTTNVSGVVDCEIRLYDKDGKNITSPRFILVVDERVVYDEEILSRYEGTALDYILGSESSRQFAEADRLLAEKERVGAESVRTTSEGDRQIAEHNRSIAEKSREDAETVRGLAEGTRYTNELSRAEAETKRKVAETKREQASATMTSMFNIVIGKIESHDVASLGAVPNYIFNNLDSFAEGDVIAIADNDFDLVCMGSATEEEKNTLGYFEMSDMFFGDISLLAGGTYIFVDGSSRKFVATTEKFSLPIGQEELDAHNNSADAHSDIRNRAEAAYSLAGEAWYEAEKVQEQSSKDIKALQEQHKSLQESASNAIKGTATGEIVRVNDVSPIEHTVKCKVKSDDASIDLASVKVTRCGKNLFDKSRIVNLALGVPNGTEERIMSDASYRGFYIPCKEGEVYSISRTNTVCNRFRYTFTQTIPKVDVPTFGTSPVYTDYSSILKYENVVAPANAKYLFLYLSNQSDEVDGIQIELGSSVTDYEEYKPISTHTPTSDGTVEGIKSVAPTMTLLTDKANTVVEIEYNQDINVLNKKLVEALDAIIAIQQILIGGTSQ